MAASGRPLWRLPGFLPLWLGQGVSDTGSQVTELAIPLTATTILDASPLEMGLLEAAEAWPVLWGTLIAVAWLDRIRKRPVMIGSNLLRALLLVSIPLAALAGALGIVQLCAVALAVGTLAVVFEVAAGAYLPSLVPADELVEANSRLTLTGSVAHVGGPGIGGVLVQLLTAPGAVVADAASFIVAAGCLARIRDRETVQTAPVRIAERIGELRDGLRTVLRDPLLRPLSMAKGSHEFFYGFVVALYVIYVTRELHLSAAELGGVYALASLGPVAGSLLASAGARRIGLGAITVLGSATPLANLLIPFASGPPLVVIALLVVARGVLGLGAVVTNVNRASVYQAVAAPALRARVGAAMRLIEWGPLPIGSLLGGALAGRIGIRPTLVLAAFGSFLAVAWLLLSPVRSLTRAPVGGG